MDDSARRFKRQGRWALMMSVFSAFSLLMCAAFAAQAERKLGIPSVAIYALAGGGGLLVLLLHLMSDSTGESSSDAYSWMARVLALLLIILNVYMSVFSWVDGKGATLVSGSHTHVIPPTPLTQVVGSIAVFAIICLLALFALWRLVASVCGNAQTSS